MSIAALLCFLGALLPVPVHRLAGAAGAGRRTHLLCPGGDAPGLFPAAGCGALPVRHTDGGRAAAGIVQHRLAHRFVARLRHHSLFALLRCPADRAALFVLSLFLLCALMSYLTGSSFGTVGTMGFVCMLLARLAGADTAACAGAISGRAAIVGDRGSPMSSAASLVATLTGTRLYDNVRALRKSARLPLLITCLFYLILSLVRPVQSVSPDLLAEMRQLFSPAPARAAAGGERDRPVRAARAHLSQYAPQLRPGAAAVPGHTKGLAPRGPVLGYWWVCRRGRLAPGGGDERRRRPLHADGMGIVLALLRPVPADGRLRRAAPAAGAAAAAGEQDRRVRRHPLRRAADQHPQLQPTMAILLTHILCREQYDDPTALAVDLSNTAIVLSPLVPWNLACAIPLETLGVGWSAIPYAMFLWLPPPVRPAGAAGGRAWR